MPDPGPWDTPDDNNFDPDGFFGNPEGQMHSSGFGDHPESYGPYFADYANIPSVWAKNMSTK
ncbi:hypothetical protein D3C83_305010 [compost metagenome]